MATEHVKMKNMSKEVRGQALGQRGSKTVVIDAGKACRHIRVEKASVAHRHHVANPRRTSSKQNALPTPLT